MKSETGNRKPETKLVPATDGSAIASYGPGPRFDFSPENPLAAVAELIAKHRGAESAITIEGIAGELWPNLWRVSVPDSKGHPDFPHRRKLQRGIKRLVSNLVLHSDKVIVSNRGHKNPGYYMPATKEEIDAAARTFIRQAVKMLKRARKLTGNSRYEELAGQLVLLAGGAAESDPQNAQSAQN